MAGEGIVRPQHGGGFRAVVTDCVRWEDV